MKIRENESLKPYTTFKIGGPARFFAAIESRQDLLQALQFARSEERAIFVLGGGSNILTSDNGIDALVLHPMGGGIALLDEDEEQVQIRVEAAEPWDRLVAYAVEHHWGGIENLSHIPGQAGAALVQNVGAYGQQISDVFETAEVAELRTRKIETLRREDCGLGYRKSIFNTFRKGQFLILALTLRLTKRLHPNLTYPDVKAWFQKLDIQEPSLEQIRQAIIAIRDRKFPYPREEKGGNAGSFFKNLTLSAQEYENLERRFETSFRARDLDRLAEIHRRFPAAEGIKIPTAFLIEACGLKSCRMGNVRVNESQPLVLLNQGGATAKDVLTLARHIRQTIYARTGVKISIEPELVGFTPQELAEFMGFE
ncbi:MAG TPA: UDP-N-acetylmuramate dehydrogenase [Terriglobia bacterium]|nr:UDP-N-acetylmuramate dehydrogenase [Terriglobia bacterium]